MILRRHWVAGVLRQVLGPEGAVLEAAGRQVPVEGLCLVDADPALLAIGPVAAVALGGQDRGDLGLEIDRFGGLGVLWAPRGGPGQRGGEQAQEQHAGQSYLPDPTGQGTTLGGQSRCVPVGRRGRQCQVLKSHVAVDGSQPHGPVSCGRREVGNSTQRQGRGGSFHCRKIEPGFVVGDSPADPIPGQKARETPVSLARLPIFPLDRAGFAVILTCEIWRPGCVDREHSSTCGQVPVGNSAGQGGAKRSRGKTGSVVALVGGTGP